MTRALVIEAPCTISSTTGSQLGRGWVDLSFDTPFFAAFEVTNNLTEQGPDNTSTGVETSEMYVNSVDVRIDMPQDPSIISAISAVDPALVEYNQLLATNSFTGGDTRGIFVEVPEATFDELRSAISNKYSSDVRLTATMNVVFHAVRASNKGVNDFGEIDSREFTLPIELCFDCLRDCTGCGAGCDSDAAVGTGLCGAAQGGSVVPSSCAATMDP